MGHSIFDTGLFIIIYKLLGCGLGAGAMIHYGKDMVSSISQTKSLKNTGRPLMMMLLVLCAIGMVIAMKPSQMFTFFERPISWFFDLMLEILRRIGIPV